MPFLKLCIAPRLQIVRSRSDISRRLGSLVIGVREINGQINLFKSGQEFFCIGQGIGWIHSIHNQSTYASCVHIRHQFVDFGSISLAYVFWFFRVKSFAGQQFVDSQHYRLGVFVVKTTHHNRFSTGFLDFGSDFINSLVYIGSSSAHIATVQFAVQFGQRNFLLGRGHRVSLVGIGAGQGHIRLHLDVTGHFPILWHTPFSVS